MDGSGHDLTGIALVIVVAVTLGALLMRLRMPAIVGYILAGVVLGPTGLGLISDTEPIAILAELGVLMLLFLVGTELSLCLVRSAHCLLAYGVKDSAGKGTFLADRSTMK